MRYDVDRLYEVSIDQIGTLINRSAIPGLNFRYVARARSELEAIAAVTRDLTRRGISIPMQATCRARLLGSSADDASTDPTPYAGARLPCARLVGI
jgi:hypothetical protein